MERLIYTTWTLNISRQISLVNAKTVMAQAKTYGVPNAVLIWKVAKMSFGIKTILINKTMETNEMNRKIAEWMGIDVEYPWYCFDPRNEDNKDYYQTHEQAEQNMRHSRTAIGCDIPNYHSDWNALMPVVEKVEMQEDVREVEMYLQSCRISFVAAAGKYPINTDAETKIKATHLAVYNYINKTA